MPTPFAFEIEGETVRQLENALLLKLGEKVNARGANNPSGILRLGQPIERI